ncbi:MAG: HlyD family efflux transporter periplasmic adaptor subunit [Solirubrobacterales bacterium]|nr:HlyD family efflux transporter periplasmic adaptor subunit [Solirubrobacterales bacterium]
MINRAADSPSQQTSWLDQPDHTDGAATAEPRRRPWYLYLLAALGVVLAVLAFAEIGPPASSARTSTQIVTAEKGIVQSTVTGSGNVAAATDINLNFQTSGTLANVYVKVGQHVEKGQLLATLNQTSAQLTLNQAEQSLTAAEDQLSSAESGSSTSVGSTTGGSGSSSGTSSSSSTTSSAATVASAQAAVDGAQASLNNARTALDNTKLYAPVSGTIASLASLSPGNTVSAGSSASAATSATSGTSSSSGSSAGSSSGTGTGSLGGASTSTSSSSSSGASSSFAEIVNTSKMTMTVAFSQSDVNKLKPGQAATVTPDALTGVQLGAHVTAISPVGSTSSNVVSYNATLTLDQNDSSVKPGMSASAAVIVGQAQGVTVPNAAVTGSGPLATVTVLRNGKQTQQQVAVGLKGQSRTQIVSGLSAGEQVVIKTTLPPLGAATTATGSGSSGTLGGTTGARPGGFGGAGGGGFGGGGGAAGGRTAGAGAGG